MRELAGAPDGLDVRKFDVQRQRRTLAAQTSLGIRFDSYDRRSAGSGWLIKRAVDVVASLWLLVALGPLLVAIALVVRLTSPGPVLIHQERVGEDLRRFPLLKFRTMVRDADRMLPELLDRNEVAPPMFKIRHDPRVTPVGAFLRRHSLDELPQLINVLRGEMSLVGPRPMLPSEVAHDLLRQRWRMELRPGMTGLWQVSGRSSLDYDEMVRLDLCYGLQPSIRRDVGILLRTVPSVLFGKEAY